MSHSPERRCLPVGPTARAFGVMTHERTSMELAVMMDQAPATHSTGIDDTTLLTRHIGGDNAALAELYARHHGRIFLYTVKMVGSAEAAEDVVQGMWERVARLRGRHMSIRQPLPFLLRIARNLALNRFRTERRFTALDETMEPATREQSDATEIVDACLAQLSEEHREVVVLSIYCGYRLEEIAEMLGKSHEAIRKRSSRAQARLRELVTEMMDNDEPRAGRTTGNYGTDRTGRS